MGRKESREHVYALDRDLYQEHALHERRAAWEGLSFGLALYGFAVPTDENGGIGSGDGVHERFMVYLW